MVYTDFIAAIDLGTAHLTGMIGVKNAAGMLTIIATEVENSGGCIRRGCVYNVEETASRIKRLVLKLETKLRGAKIAKVYVGIGGQSLRSMNYSVYRDLGNDGVVTEEMLESLYEECRRYRPDLLDSLAAVSPVYLLDGRPEKEPAGIPCEKIEAQYKLIVGRPSLKRYVMNSIAERAKIEVADIFVSPLALANAVLSEDEKKMGCALIDFGAGTSKLIVYKGGKLVDLSVIPFGGNIVTSDIKSLNIIESEAERVKLEYGCATADLENETTVQITSADGLNDCELKLAELNNVIEARVKEILENIIARLEATGIQNELGAGIIITGGASELKGLATVVKERLNMNVRFAFLRKGIVENDRNIAGRSGEFSAVGLLMQGTENCALQVVPPVGMPTSGGGSTGSLFNEEDVVSQEEKDKLEREKKERERKEKERKEKEKKERREKAGNFFGRITKGIDNFGKNLFDDEDTSK